MNIEGVGDIISSMESLILLLNSSGQSNLKELKMVLKCAVRLCDVRREHCEKFVELLGSQLVSIEGE